VLSTRRNLIINNQHAFFNNQDHTNLAIPVLCHKTQLSNNFIEILFLVTSLGFLVQGESTVVNEDAKLIF
jgi:hypothetical protein